MTVERDSGRWHDLSGHWAMAEWHAELWNQSHEKHGLKENAAVFSNQNVIGILGEFVYWFETGLYPNLSAGFKEGADFSDGTDTKANHELWGHLLVPEGKAMKEGVKLWALVIIDQKMKRGILVGTAPPEQVAAAPVKTLRWKPTHMLEQSELTPWEPRTDVRPCPCRLCIKEEKYGIW